MAEAAVRQAEARVELSRHQITVLNATRCCRAAAGPRCGRRVPPICAIGLVFYTLAWRATRRMQVNA
jgi:hypothetical protein